VKIPSVVVALLVVAVVAHGDALKHAHIVKSLVTSASPRRCLHAHAVFTKPRLNPKLIFCCAA
jgi:hypothetical protein